MSKKAEQSDSESEYLMLAKTKHTSPFKALMERLATQFSECPLVFLPKESEDTVGTYYQEGNKAKTSKKQKAPKCKKTGGIRIHKLTVDSHVLIKVNLHADDFDEFVCQSVISVFVDLHYFNNALKAVDDQDIIIMFISKANPSVLHIRTCRDKADNDKKSTKDITISLTEADPEQIELMSIKRERTLMIDMDFFKQICKRVDDNSSHIEIVSIGNEIIFRGSNEFVTFSESIEATEYTGDDSKSDNIIQSKYNIKTVMDFSKCKKMHKVMEMNLINKCPLILVVKVGPLGKMYVFIAPLNEPKK